MTRARPKPHAPTPIAAVATLASLGPGDLAVLTTGATVKIAWQHPAATFVRPMLNGAEGEPRSYPRLTTVTHVAKYSPPVKDSAPVVDAVARGAAAEGGLFATEQGAAA